MTFDKSNFSKASNHYNDNIVATYNYTTTDAVAAVDSAQYFNSVVDEINVGDVVIAKCSDGTFMLVCASNDGTDVDMGDSMKIAPNSPNVYLCDRIADVSTAGQVYVTSPIAGTVTKVDTVLNGAIATADAVLTVKDGDGNSMGTITIANASSAAGDQDSLTPVSNNVVAAGEKIEVETNGASTNTISVGLLLTIAPITDTD